MRENLESDGDRMITTVDMPQDSQWDLWKMGSLIVFQCASGEVVVTLQIVWRQDGCSTGLIRRWEIDSDASCEFRGHHT